MPLRAGQQPGGEDERQSDPDQPDPKRSRNRRHARLPPDPPGVPCDFPSDPPYDLVGSTTQIIKAAIDRGLAQQSAIVLLYAALIVLLHVVSYSQKEILVFLVINVLVVATRQNILCLLVHEKAHCLGMKA